MPTPDQLQQKIVSDVLIEDFIARHLHDNPKYRDERRLNRHEYQVYSQGGEDGIISEIFRRIGTTNRFFAEFGVGNGLENNTTHLLVRNWSGVWIEGNPASCATIQQKFATLLKKYRLTLKQAFITAENIQTLLTEAGVPEEPDFMCIDIDGNDYWVWKALTAFKPRVVAIEYNATFGPETEWIMKYNPEHLWSGGCYFNSSLKSLEKLGTAKGYHLVGCSFSGVNAFFVRSDLCNDAFMAPYTSENHFEPARYFLLREKGMPRDFGDFVTEE